MSDVQPETAPIPNAIKPRTFDRRRIMDVIRTACTQGGVDIDTADPCIPDLLAEVAKNSFQLSLMLGNPQGAAEYAFGAQAENPYATVAYMALREYCNRELPDRNGFGIDKSQDNSFGRTVQGIFTTLVDAQLQAKGATPSGRNSFHYADDTNGYGIPTISWVEKMSTQHQDIIDNPQIKGLYTMLHVPGTYQPILKAIVQAGYYAATM